MLLAFAVQTFNKAFIVVEYFTNTKAFEKLCENKARPQLQCKGKCQMVKKLKEQEKKDEQVPERKAENKDEVVLFYKNLLPVPWLGLVLQNTFSSQFIGGKETKMPRFLLRPPGC